MPSADKSVASDQLKILFMGDSGTGKTGALASLAEAGYKLRILDFDNGIQPLIEFTAQAFKKNIVWETFKDTYKFVNNFMNAVDPKAAARAMNMLDKWVDSETKEDLGSPASWGKDTIVVLDSLSLFGRACLAFVMKKNNQTVPRIQDWGEAMNLVSGTISSLTSPAFGPHVIINTHVNYLESDEGVVFKGVPQSIGKGLNLEIPKYFNIILGATSKGSRKIHTAPAGFMDYKFPKAGIPATLPLASGLREIFRFLRGTEPVAHPASQQKA